MPFFVFKIFAWYDFGGDQKFFENFEKEKVVKIEATILFFQRKL